ncbi:hypothetical protein GCM10017788_15780 [Amycolatopsis acidiphila]|nr:hypothetical protein GCM10017788_15780 [Amycolatopsis acidiphila]
MGGAFEGAARHPRGLRVRRVADQQCQRDITAELAVPRSPEVSAGTFVDTELGKEPVPAVADDTSGREGSTPRADPDLLAPLLVHPTLSLSRT